MKANELRIGNWVNNNEEDYQITSATIAQLERGDSTAKTIPLTEEWLLRFGFKKVPIKSFILNRFIAYFNEDKTLWFGQLGMQEAEKIKENIEYLHQLQNLYFALTGEELTINQSNK